MDARVVSFALEQPDLSDLDEPASLPFPHEHPFPRVQAARGLLCLGCPLQPGNQASGVIRNSSYVSLRSRITRPAPPLRRGIQAQAQNLLFENSKRSSPRTYSD